MREYKFKAWDITHKKWYSRVHVGTNCGHAVYDDEREMWLEFDEFCGEVVQWTGLKDRNGNEIWESDIVKQTYHKEMGDEDYGSYSFDGHHIGEVVITASKGVCMKKPLNYSLETDETSKSNQYKTVSAYRCEIIGNIYEHPELINS